MIFMNSRNRKCTASCVLGGMRPSMLVFSKIPYADYFNHSYSLTMINQKLSCRGLYSLNKESGSCILGFKDD